MLILSIVLSVIVGVLFKYFNIYNIDSLQALVVNYFVCVITASITLGDFGYLTTLFDTKWGAYAMIMGVWFFIVFNCIRLCIQYHGVTITSAFQKLSLIAPVLAAILFFNENLTSKIILGILSTIASILILNFKKEKSSQKLSIGLSILPIIVWIGSCGVDLSLYLVEKSGLTKGQNMQFTSALFLFAGITSGCFLLYKLLTKQSKIQGKNLLAGVILGVPNFFSIYLIMLLLERGWNGSTLFPIMNVGIIILAGIVSFILFKEKIDTRKAIGYAFAIVAIILLS